MTTPDPAHAAAPAPDRDESAIQFRTLGTGSRESSRRPAGRSVRQGRIAFDQLRHLGVGKATIGRWPTRADYLFWELPRVYAVGHPGRTIESDLAAAVLYAGPGRCSTALRRRSGGSGSSSTHRAQIYVSTPAAGQDYGQHRRPPRRTIWTGSGIGACRSRRRARRSLTTPPPARARPAPVRARKRRIQGLLDIRALQAPAPAAASPAAPRSMRRWRSISPSSRYTRSRAERLLLILCQASASGSRTT